MSEKIVAALPAFVRPLLEPQLPNWVQARWFQDPAQARTIAPDAQIGWLDMRDQQEMAAAITAATELKWLSSIYAGVDGMPLQLLRERGVRLTNGAGINALTIAEYVVMGMLTIAKGYRQVVRAQDRHEWLSESPGKVELAGSRALILGYGAIGKLVEQRLRAFDVAVTVVRRNPIAVSAAGAANAGVSNAAGERVTEVLGPEQWRARLADFDWIILAVPATAQTRHMIGVNELAAMKPSATLMNVARGTVIDQTALVQALGNKQIGAAFLDVTDPEPLPPDHPLWTLENVHITMHLSGNAQTKMIARSTQRFVENLARYRAGEALQFQVDLTQGY